MMISPDQERELTAETNERRKRTIEQIVLDNECSISPLYGLIGQQRGFSGPVSIIYYLPQESLAPRLADCW